MRVADFIFQYLRAIGVTDVFYVSGGMCMHLVDALHKSGINPVHMLHEQSAGIAADAYAQITGNLGVVLCTSGPGALNCLTSCSASYIDSTPVLYISGQCKSADLNNGSLRQKGCQEIDIISMVRGITKFSAMVSNKENIDSLLKNAVSVAKSDRSGTVWLDLPLDIQGQEI